MTIAQDGCRFPVTQQPPRCKKRACFSWLACAIVALTIAQAQAQTAYSETVLHNFASPPKGAFPYAGVISDSAGNLYGTANSGGAANAGVVYKVDTAGRQTVLYSFTGGADGGNPYGGVVRDAAGNLYGTTVYGGAASSGVVFKVDSSGHETVLYTFSGGDDGGYPYAGVIRDSAGNLYGTTSLRGNAQWGVVYSLDPTGNETVLYSFTGGSDGASPYAGVIRDSAGNLYGTASSGGTGNMGVVYKVDTAGHETVLYSFTGGADGGYPYAGVIRDSSGNLYGTAQQGGTRNLGVIYSVNTAGQETVLYTFTGAADGAAPYAGVIRDSAGNLYGTTLQGGIGNVGAGVYKLDPAGHETAPPNFPNAPGGTNPYAGVIRDSAGNLYGTTTGGGPANAGVVYKLSPAGQETVLYSFTGGADGRNPYAGVTRDSAGNLYGTTLNGGTGKWGVRVRTGSGRT